MDVTSDPLNSGLRAMRRQALPPRRELTRTVMADVRMYPRPGRNIPTGGGASVNETEIANLIRGEADAIEGVRARRCRIRPSRDTQGRTITGPLEVELGFAVSYGSNIPAAGERLMRKVREALAERYGMSVGSLRLNVVDLTPPDIL